MHRLLLPQGVSHTFTTERHRPYLREADFDDTVPLRDFIFNDSLITAFVKRWHSKTYIFYLPWGGATITLWYGTETWKLVEQLLGAIPPMVAE
ncbi:hypothetical protein AHAS_Ahas01G0118200 [Arachis hypogaea]